MKDEFKERIEESVLETKQRHIMELFESMSHGERYRTKLKVEYELLIYADPLIIAAVSKLKEGL